MKLTLLFVGLILGLSIAVFTDGKVGYSKPFEITGETNYQMDWFTNFLNQVDQSDKRMYKQRFWYSTEDFDKENGPIFLYICGEYTCSIPTTREFPHQLAQKHRGFFMVLEHRYYGESQPFDDWTTESLKYLTVENALADTAMFLEVINEKLQKQFGGQRRQVVVIGGSYPGAVSAWMRYKYPHVVDASISSSGVVNAILNYDMYDYQVYNSTSRSEGECAGVIRNMTTALDTFMEFNHTEQMQRVKAMFGAEELSDKDFSMLFSDQFAGKVQYGARTEMCAVLEQGSYADVWTQFNITAAYVGKTDVDSYHIEALKNTTVDYSKNMRQWTYQTCTEVAYFQTAYTPSSMRPKIIDLDYYRETCHKAFGDNIWPNVNHTNLLLGETHLARTNIFFTNGVEDPWKWAGAMAVPEHSGMEAQVVDCDDCAHCVELYTPKDSDAPTLKAARQRIEVWLANILNDGTQETLKDELKRIIE